MQDKRPEKAAKSRAGLSHHGSPVLGSVGERRKEMCWQKINPSFSIVFSKREMLCLEWYFHLFIYWIATPVFLPGESHEQRSLAGYVHGVAEYCI